MKKRRWFVPIAIAVGAISTIAYGPIWYFELENRGKSAVYIRRLFMSDYSTAYLVCGLYNHLDPHKGGPGSCYIHPDTEKLTMIHCYVDDPLCSDLESSYCPRSSLDTWLLRNTNKEDFAIIKPEAFYDKNCVLSSREKYNQSSLTGSTLTS